MRFLSLFLLLSNGLLANTLALPASSVRKTHSPVQLSSTKLVRRGTGLVGVDPLEINTVNTVATQWTAPVLVGGLEVNLLIDTGTSNL